MGGWWMWCMDSSRRGGKGVRVTGSCVNLMPKDCFWNSTLNEQVSLLMRKPAVGGQDIHLLCGFIKSQTIIFIFSCYAAHAVISAAGTTSKAKPLSANACDLQNLWHGNKSNQEFTWSLNKLKLLLGSIYSSFPTKRSDGKLIAEQRMLRCWYPAMLWTICYIKSACLLWAGSLVVQ